MWSLAHTPVRLLLECLSSKAAGSALWTDNDVCPAFPAASHTDCVFQSLHSVDVNEGPLYGRLAYVRRKNFSCCRRTIHIEPGAVHGCLNGHPLTALKHVLLGLTSRRCKHAHQCEKHVSHSHNDSSDVVWFLSAEQTSLSGRAINGYRTLGQWLAPRCIVESLKRCIVEECLSD